MTRTRPPTPLLPCRERGISAIPGGYWVRLRWLHGAPQFSRAFMTPHFGGDVALAWLAAVAYRDQHVDGDPHHRPPLNPEIPFAGVFDVGCTGRTTVPRIVATWRSDGKERRGYFAYAPGDRESRTEAVAMAIALRRKMDPDRPATIKHLPVELRRAVERVESNPPIPTRRTAAAVYAKRRIHG